MSQLDLILAISVANLVCSVVAIVQRHLTYKHTKNGGGE